MGATARQRARDVADLLVGLIDRLDVLERRGGGTEVERLVALEQRVARLQAMIERFSGVLDRPPVDGAGGDARVTGQGEAAGRAGVRKHALGPWTVPADGARPAFAACRVCHRAVELHADGRVTGAALMTQCGAATAGQRVCEGCGERYVPRGGRQRFCGVQCPGRAA